MVKKFVDIEFCSDVIENAYKLLELEKQHNYAYGEASLNIRIVKALRKFLGVLFLL